VPKNCAKRLIIMLDHLTPTKDEARTMGMPMIHSRRGISLRGPAVMRILTRTNYITISSLKTSRMVKRSDDKNTVDDWISYYNQLCN
jgi:hypothetical protein